MLYLQLLPPVPGERASTFLEIQSVMTKLWRKRVAGDNVAVHGGLWLRARTSFHLISLVFVSLLSPSFPQELLEMG